MQAQEQLAQGFGYFPEWAKRAGNRSTDRLAASGWDGFPGTLHQFPLYFPWRFLEKQNIQGWGELAGKDARSEPHQWAVDMPDWLGTGHLLVRFARGEGAPSADRKDNLIFCDDFALSLDNFSILKVCQGYVMQGKTGISGVHTFRKLNSEHLYAISRMICGPGKSPS